MGNTDQPLTAQVLKHYLCTPAFTLSLDFTAQATSPGTDDHGVPPLSLYSSGNTNELIEPGWCPANVATGVCDSESSVPQRILVPKGSTPASALLSIQGIPNNCEDAQSVTSCDYQTSITVTLGGTTTTGPVRRTITGTIKYYYAEGDGFARSATGPTQLTPSRETMVEILASSKSSCSKTVLSSLYTNDDGVYTDTVTKQKYVCVKVVAATSSSEIIPYPSDAASSASKGAQLTDDAYASKALGPIRLA
jgi:hypothetical protein